MKSIRLLILAGFAAGFFVRPAPAADTPVVAASTGPIVLTLPQSVSLAVEGATEILKAKNNLNFTGTQLLQTYMEFLPDLQAHGNYTWQSGREYITITAPTSISTTNRSMNYSLTSTLNLFNGFADAAALHSGRERNAAATMTLYRAKQAIILDVTQAYLQVLLDQNIMGFADSNFKSSKQREDLLQAQTDVGSRSLADYYRQQAQTSADELFLIQSQNRTRDDLIFLLRRLRVDLMKEYALADVVLDTSTVNNPYAGSQEQALLQEALSQRADLRAFEESAKATQSDVTVARSGYFPRLDAFADMTGTGQLLDRQIVDGVDQLPVPQQPLGRQLGENILYSAGLNLNWGIFSRYQTRTDVVRAETIAKDAQIDYEDLKLQVEGDVKETLGDFRASMQQLDSARRGVTAAQESYDAVQERYKVGASSIVDLLTAQSALVQAQTADAQARIGYVVEKQTMDNVLGRTRIP